MNAKHKTLLEILDSLDQAINSIEIAKDLLNQFDAPIVIKTYFKNIDDAKIKWARWKTSDYIQWCKDNEDM